MTITINQAFEQGRAAVQGAHNPYSQRGGEPWHVENQDQLFDAWARGYRSEHDKSEWLQIAREIVKGAYLPAEIPREKLFDKEAEAESLAEWLDSRLQPEFDRINHGPFEHPVSEPAPELSWKSVCKVWNDACDQADAVNGAPLSILDEQTCNHGKTVNQHCPDCVTDEFAE